MVCGTVTDKMFRDISARLKYLSYTDPEEPIQVIVNSPGGSADSGFGIYDMMNFVTCPIKTVCAGLCASAAVLIYLGASEEDRYALPNARFLLHQPSTQAFGQASDMEITANEILKTRQKYADVVAQKTGQNADKIMEDSNRDFWLGAEEAQKYGLVNKIVTSEREI